MTTDMSEQPPKDPPEPKVPSNPTDSPISDDRLPVDLALQGGGSHGAFAWGVLDRLLEEPRIRIDGISGTSAGAMNAAVLASGFATGGADEARQALTDFWRRVSNGALLSPLKRGPLDILLGRWTLDYSPAFLALDMASRVFSPYDLNPAAWNPLRDILAESIDFDRLVSSPVKIFITATCVRTGRPTIFRNANASPDALLASACLPQMFQARQGGGVLAARRCGGAGGSTPEARAAVSVRRTGMY